MVNDERLMNLLRRKSSCTVFVVVFSLSRRAARYSTVLINPDRSPKESISSDRRSIRIQGIVIGIESAQLETPFHFVTPFSEPDDDIESGDLRWWNTAVHGSLSKGEVQAPRLGVPSAAFFHTPCMWLKPNALSAELVT
jgi:hypothetical protein